MKYPNLPLFLRDYNECKGWNDADDVEYLIDALDFIERIQLVKATETKGSQEVCKSLLKLAQESIDEKQKLYILNM